MLIVSYLEIMDTFCIVFRSTGTCGHMGLILAETPCAQHEYKMSSEIFNIQHQFVHTTHSQFKEWLLLSVCQHSLHIKMFFVWKYYIKMCILLLEVSATCCKYSGHIHYEGVLNMLKAAPLMHPVSGLHCSKKMHSIVLVKFSGLQSWLNQSSMQQNVEKMFCCQTWEHYAGE